jgi:hypothetical protein
VIHRPDVFVAEPSNNAKMRKDMSMDPRRREQKRRVNFEMLDVITMSTSLKRSQK